MMRKNGLLRFPSWEGQAVFDQMSAGSSKAGTKTASAANSFSRRSVPVSAINIDPLLIQEMDQKQLGELAAVIAAFGLRDPITLTADFKLLAGAKLFAVAQRLGWTTIDAVVVDS